ncbi:hypothetical protein AN403_5387 [Pseudomonas fluorescens]|uniref:Uncharacterized protein n=1 Tax=Pseudomonas fluorescens TaxID=294 RepID=A0A0P8X5J8_PSEFL|nr:hypothetical protein AN403_5387 [Pseudomonas fluorescens]
MSGLPITDAGKYGGIFLCCSAHKDTRVISCGVPNYWADREF